MATVTNDEMQRYLQRFHEEYAETVESFIGSSDRTQLDRYSRLPTAIVGYISTMHGSAFEYVGGSAGEVMVRSSSRRIEDFVFDPPPTLRVGRAATGILLRDSTRGLINQCEFSGMAPLRLEGNSDVIVSDVTANFGTRARTVRYAELFTARDADFWSLEYATKRAKDEVLAALVDLQEARARNLSIAEYLPELKKNLVLVLGSFSRDGRVRLNEIRSALDDLGYVTLLLDEVPDLPGQDLLAKVTTVGCLARFVVVDDSEAGGQLAEVAAGVYSRWLLAVLRLKESRSSWMTRGLAAGSSNVYESEYSTDDVYASVARSVKWAEQRLADVDARLATEFPWRISVDGEVNP